MTTYWTHHTIHAHAISQLVSVTLNAVVIKTVQLTIKPHSISTARFDIAWSSRNRSTDGLAMTCTTILSLSKTIGFPFYAFKYKSQYNSLHKTYHSISIDFKFNFTYILGNFYSPNDLDALLNSNNNQFLALIQGLFSTSYNYLSSIDTSNSIITRDIIAT